MDIRKVFRGISRNLYNDFEISSQINNDGIIGGYRENALAQFLEQGRLPNRYGVGTGEIISSTNHVSKQSDLIIFDQLDNVPLLYDSKVQVYPIDCIYGIIEIKSQLSKQKLIEGLENIKSVKQLAPNGTFEKDFMLMTTIYKKPKPFGFIFAYSLGKNSLNSLVENLIAWEKVNDVDFWPNAILVLGEGIILHLDKETSKKVVAPKLITTDCSPFSFKLKHDSFFHFYSHLLDACKSIVLPEFELSKFLDIPSDQVE